MHISWDDHRYFLAIARAGSLTGAAKLLGVSQPTVSRRLEAMEANLKVRLFDRTRQGYMLTVSGSELFEVVLGVEEKLMEADRNLFGKDQDVSGSLRFTSTEIFFNGYLGKFIFSFLKENADIDLHLMCTQSTLSLSRGEADVAIRFTDSPPDTLVGKRLVQTAYGIYASAGLSGGKFSTDNRSNWEWIGMQTETYNRMLFGTFAPEVRLKHRVDNMDAMHGMVRAGLGVAILPCYTADRDPKLVRLNPEPLLDPKFDMWILFHPESRRAQRLRLFVDFATNRIKKDVDLFEGRRPILDLTAAN